MNSDARIGGSYKIVGPWAICFQLEGKYQWIAHFETPNSGAVGRVLYDGRLGIVSTVTPSFGPIKSATVHYLDSSSGQEVPVAFDPVIPTSLTELVYPRQFDKQTLLAGGYGNATRFNHSVLTISNGKWLTVLQEPMFDLPAGFPPTALVQDFIVRAEAKPLPNGFLIMGEVTIKIDRGRTVSAAALCAVDANFNIQWTRAIGTPTTNFLASAFDCDIDGSSYIALTEANNLAPKSIVVFALSPQGDLMLTGWPQRLKLNESLEASAVSITSRDIFVAGTRGGFMAGRPFVAAFKRNGSSTGLFGSTFNEGDEIWRAVDLVADGDHFYLGGYTIERDPSDARGLHQLQIAKFDRYGLPA